MCGRFTLYSDPKTLAQRFNVKEYREFAPSYNISPSQPIPVIFELDDKERRMALMRWGLIPVWMKEENISSAFINARVETALTKPSFKHAILKRRCLIPADGFYEWSHQGTDKQPYLIKAKDQKPFAIAGIWESWKGKDKMIDSCCILTCDAADIIKNIHSRMPVIIPDDQYDKWLDNRKTNAQDIKRFIHTLPQLPLQSYPVSKNVNDPHYNREELLREISLIG